jgi:hypothetical protein
MRRGEFDTVALSRRAGQWRIEAARVPAGSMRAFCFREARQCERRLRQSFDTLVICGCRQSSRFGRRAEQIKAAQRQMVE